MHMSYLAETEGPAHRNMDFLGQDLAVQMTSEIVGRGTRRMDVLFQGSLNQSLSVPRNYILRFCPQENPHCLILLQLDLVKRFLSKACKAQHCTNQIYQSQAHMGDATYIRLWERCSQLSYVWHLFCVAKSLHRC